MNIKELIIGLTVSMLLGIGVAVTAHVIRGLKNKLYNWFPKRRRFLLWTILGIKGHTTVHGMSKESFGCHQIIVESRWD